LVETLRYTLEDHGSIPDGSLRFLIDITLQAATVALESIQSLTEMSTRDLAWGVKAAGV
jgi:hypothetical protein